MIFLILIFLFYINFSRFSVNAEALPIVRYCDFNGVFLYTEAFNYQSNKEAIIFIHGLCANHTDGDFLFKDENKYLTISIDMLNHGKSGKTQNITFDIYIDSIKAVIDDYKVQKVHFVGHSLGADMAMMFAYKYPEYVINIIIIDRSYYNFSDVSKYNFTKEFYKVIEYNADFGLDFDAFNSLIDMSLKNDISITWNINKDVLLLAANPYWPTCFPSIVDQISNIKKAPADFGITYELASSLPNLTEDNLKDYMEFLDAKINEFKLKNKRFFVVKTKFEHNMVSNDLVKPQLLKYVLEFINNDDKNLAIKNINRCINNN